MYWLLYFCNSNNIGVTVFPSPYHCLKHCSAYFAKFLFLFYMFSLIYWPSKNSSTIFYLLSSLFSSANFLLNFSNSCFILIASNLSYFSYSFISLFLSFQYYLYFRPSTFFNSYCFFLFCKLYFLWISISAYNAFFFYSLIS